MLINETTTMFESHLECTLVQLAERDTFTLTVTDRVSGAVLGMRNLFSDGEGNPPAITVGDALEMVGGSYRLGCVRVDLECRLLRIKGARIAGMIRRQGRRMRFSGMTRGVH